MPATAAQLNEGRRRQYPHEHLGLTPLRLGVKGVFVLTSEFTEYVNPIIERRIADEARFCQDPNSTGVIDRIITYAAKVKGTTYDAAARRFYDARNQTFKCLSVDWADAFLISIGEDGLDQAPLTILPGSRNAAAEMAEAWADDEVQEQHLRRSLRNFAVGMTADFDVVCDGIRAEMEEVA